MKNSFYIAIKELTDMSILNLSNTDDRITEELPVEEKIISDDNRGTSETDPNIQDTSTEAKDAKVITMDGPLSHIYTAALNLMLAKEGSAASANTDLLLVFPEDEVDEQAENNSDLYVYCCDAKDIDSQQALYGTDKLRLALDNKKYKKVMMVMEGNRQIGKSAGLLEEYAYKEGVPIVFIRDLALIKICETVKG